MKLTRSVINKRRAIAKDVVAQIKAGKFTAQRGAYITFQENRKTGQCLETFVGEELQKVLPKIVTKQKPCTVCAIGSVFMSAVFKFDKYRVSTCAFSNPTGIPTLDMRHKVTEFFSLAEQAALEQSFEILVCEANYQEFLRDLDDEDRLTWLMQVVAENPDEEITLALLRKQALISITTDERFSALIKRLGLI